MVKRSRLSWKEVETKFVGKKFRRRDKTAGQQTLRVIDVTFGGDIVCMESRQRVQHIMKQPLFLEWVRFAKIV